MFGNDDDDIFTFLTLMDESAAREAPNRPKQTFL